MGDEVDDVVVDKKDENKEAPPAPVEQQMLEGIKAAVTPEDPAKVAEKKAAEEAAAAAAVATAEANKGKTPEQIEAAAVEKKKKDDLEAAAKLKARSADDFALRPEEKKVLSQPAQARFQELHAFGKAQQEEARVAKAEVERLTNLTRTMQEVYDDFQVEPDDLAELFNFNLKLKTGDWAGALAFVDEARVEILKAMGKEAPGVDLLEEFPDLKGKVDGQEMLREHALEIAASRRREAAAKEERARETNTQTQEQRLEGDRQKGLAAIEAWDKQMAAKDLDYKAKAAKIDGKIQEIIKENYNQPGVWLPLIKARYEGIEIVKEAAAPGGKDTPLRPSGTKVGAKTHGELTPEALKDGLRQAGFGY